MKKYILILMLAFSSFLMAKNYNLGLKVGGTYSNSDIYYYNQVTGNDDGITNNDYYWGTIFSVYGNINVNKLFFIQVEASLNQKGLIFKRPTSSHGDARVTFQLVEVDSMIKLNTKYIRPYIGVFHSYTLYKSISDDDPDDSSVKFYGDEGLNTDAGYILGFEVYYKNYLLDFRYSKGFNIIYGELGSEYWSYYDNSRQFVLSFGYEF